MKRKKYFVEVSYRYIIGYHHDEHLQDQIDELLKSPRFGCRGAGSTSDGKFGGYSVELQPGGRIVDEGAA